MSQQKALSLLFLVLGCTLAWAVQHKQRIRKDPPKPKGVASIRLDSEKQVEQSGVVSVTLASETQERKATSLVQETIKARLQSGTAGSDKPPLRLQQEQQNQASASSESAHTDEAALYGQLSTLSDEFAAIRKDDELHVRKLLAHVKLREKLQQRLEEQQKTLRADDELLTQRIQSVEAFETGANSTSGEQPGSSLSLLQNAQTQEFGFLSKAEAARVNASLEMQARSEDLAKTALASIATLEKQLELVRSKDHEEVQALESNAKKRETLKNLIKKQQEQLSEDAEGLEGSLTQIEHLATPEEAAAAAVAPAAATADATAPAADAAATAAKAEDAGAQPGAASVDPALGLTDAEMMPQSSMDGDY